MMSHPQTRNLAGEEKTNTRIRFLFFGKKKTKKPKRREKQTTTVVACGGLHEPEAA